MMRQCFRDPASVRFVGSQDGDVRAMTRVGDQVLFWESIRLQRLTNIRLRQDDSESSLASDE
jgi:hypothetical protein